MSVINLLGNQCLDNRCSNRTQYRCDRISPSVSSQTNETSKLGADKHREMAVFEVPLIANGLAAETGAGKAIRSATTNVTLCIATVNT